jgi:hypothetical protein
MNLMGLWAVAAGTGVGFVVDWVRCLKALRGYRHFMLYFSASIATMLLIVSFINTQHLRRDLVEDEISRVLPASVAVDSAKVNGPGPTFIVTMDPLVVQMYANPDTRVADLESIDTKTLTTLIQAESRLILLRRIDRFASSDLERYGEPVRYVLSLPSRPLANGEGFEVSLLEPRAGDVH